MTSIDPLRLTRFFDSAPVQGPASSLARLPQDDVSYHFYDGSASAAGLMTGGSSSNRRAGALGRFQEEQTRAFKLERTAPPGGVITAQPAATVGTLPSLEAELIAQRQQQQQRPATGASRRKSASAAAAGTARPSRVPRPHSAAQPGQRVPCLEANKFRLGHTWQPKVVEEEAVEDTGSSIATPAQRRREAAQIVQRERAYRVLKKARNDRQRTLDLMRQRFPAGVLGVDSPATGGTFAYAQQQATLQTRARRVQEHARRRRKQLAHKWHGGTLRGYDLLSNSKARAAAVRTRDGTGMFQAKARASEAPKHDTHTTLFGALALKKGNAARCQALRNQVTQGRKYNIISGDALRHVPPTAAEARHARLAHPSMIASGYPVNR